jgi:hypothetical protein
MRTDEVLDELVRALHANCGDLFNAAKQCTLSVQFIKNWCKDDEEVRSRVEEAQQVGFMGLESAAIQRAVHGISKGVYYKGERVDEEIVYSDGLLVKLLEANNPKYAKGGEATNVYNGPVQINQIPRAENFQEWLDMVQQTKQAQLPPSQVVEGVLIEADYERLPDKLQGLTI